ncbi:S8/S53 family peptidase [Hymenobacter weizhouensis]|uniref:S8/S53 family peptidase n=1 Tax=Hymenobacter sp. YIM 151500-1 TaxID=2987689 RepID=UPI00222670E5|nr:S8/S53 family peptidase [Hymenobacter sp. YIM 151500-1]UYZ64216.1 S8/S53 family peptidase [Hymenobacter sp. YIM 151500-1]
MRTTTLATAALLAAALASCQHDSAEQAAPQPSSEPMTVQQLDETILDQLRRTGEFNWNQAPEHVVWSALRRSDQVLSVGYRPAGFRGRIPAHAATDPAWQAARQQVLNLILAEERAGRPELTVEQLLAYDENQLPVLDVNVRELSTIRRLRQSGLVRYAEPIGYEPNRPRDNGTASTLFDFGCGANVPTPDLVAGSDFTVLSNGSRSSWHQTNRFHGIRAAWSQSTGRGIKVLIIDSGSAEAQENLGSGFNQGLSSGRTVERLVTLPRPTFLGIPTGPQETPDDPCGHGTSMAGVCAAPRGTDGASVGVAFNADLVTVRATTDVFLDESREVKGVADAFLLAGSRPDVRIISMSLGRLTTSSQITDAIQYAHSQGKLIFCAAGTSLSFTAGFVGVIFPASLPEAVAVTGQKDDLNTPTRCSECHVGPDVEFTVVMQKASNDRRPLTLAQDGDEPATVGGSSVATASMAGMAAVVWSRYPTESRAQIMSRLVAASSNRTRRDASFGWGRVNVAEAVGAPAL